MEVPQTLAGFEALLRQAQGNAHVCVRLARRMLAAGFTDEARRVAEQALIDAAGDAEVTALARKLLSTRVPAWHFSLVSDETRNRAYDEALRRAVTPGCRVLEIGTGTGLLAMMAARAGAGEVVSCEANPTIADMARRIIAENGYADRVTIVAKHSDDLALGEDLSGPAHILVSEIISNDLFSEMALPAIVSARRLLAPDARIIPVTVSARVALAEGPEPRLMGADTGFDLSAFNVFHRTTKMLPVDTADLKLRSAPGDLFHIDFQTLRHAQPARASIAVEAHGGRVNGVAQWLRMSMDGVGEYENCPQPDGRSCWAVMFHYLEPGIEPRPGDRVSIHGAHDLTTLDLWVDRG